MIYTITLNPTLDITYTIKRFAFGESLKAVDVEKTPGGKGINVSRALRSMGYESVAMGLIGGYAGEEVISLLQQEGLILQIVRIKSETRTNVVIIGEEDGHELMIRAAGPVVEHTETERITGFFFRVVTRPEALVLSGSLPKGVRKDIYFSIIKEGRSRGTRVILDSSGEPFRIGLEAGPYLIKPNLDELQEIAGKPLTTDEDVVGFCRELMEKGISVVVVSLGGEGALMVTPDEVLKGKVPKFEGDTVGAGDSMVAGLVMGISEEKPLEDVFRMGLGCGVSAVANHGPGLCEPESYDRLFGQVEVERLE